MFKNSNYSIILNDKRLNLKDKGLYILLCEISDSLTLSVKSITEINKDGRDSVRNSLSKLKDFEYIKREKARAAK